jgi:hypothetical protein
VKYIAEYSRQPEKRTDWTRCNLDALRTFVEDHYRDQIITSYLLRKHRREEDKKDGEYLTFDFAAYNGKHFLLFAESEFDNRSDKSLQGDFEKLFYVRAPCKVMICWVSSDAEVLRVAKMLGDYANEVCDHFSEGEVYILYFANWGSGREECAFCWQAPGHPPDPCEMQFEFRSIGTC